MKAIFLDIDNTLLSFDEIPEAGAYEALDYLKKKYILCGSNKCSNPVVFFS